MAADDDARAKTPTDPLKAYIVVFALLSAFIGFLYLQMSREGGAYAQANEEAPRLIGDRVADPASDRRPSTLYALGSDVWKYTETYKASQIKPEEGGGIPNKLIMDRIEIAHMSMRTSTVQKQKVALRGYEENSITYNMEPATIRHFAELLYSIEGQSTSLRVLDLSWQLRPAKENPYPPGDAIWNESFRVGTRRPIVER
jgi:hypothetical protein